MAPFQTFGGKPLVRGVRKKAARLFHSLIVSHPFMNGNKRTAIIALDHFLLVNSYDLVLDSSALRDLATYTAGYGERGISHAEAVRTIDSELMEWTIPFRELPDTLQYPLKQYRTSLRKHQLIKKM